MKLFMGPAVRHATAVDPAKEVAAAEPDIYTCRTNVDGKYHLKKMKKPLIDSRVKIEDDKM
jgi:hypothetical protein